MNALSYAMTFALRSMRIKLMKLMSIAKYIDGRQLGWVNWGQWSMLTNRRLHGFCAKDLC